MVEITEISNQKNKDKFNLFVDGEFFSGILKETAIADNLFVGKKIEEQALKDIIVASEAKQAFSKASDYLATRLHSCRELQTKLLAKGYSKQAIQMAIDKLKEYGYINDQQFAKEFVACNTKFSKRQLEQKLSSRGIYGQVACEALNDVDDDLQLQTAVMLAQKYLRGKDGDNLKTKLYAHLSRKGFEHWVISKAITLVMGSGIED